MKKWRAFLLSRRNRRVGVMSPSVSGAGRPRRVRRRSQKSLGGRVKGAVSAPLAGALRLVPYAVVCVLTATLPLFGYKLYVELMTSPHFALAQVAIEGCQRLTEDEVMAASGLSLGENVVRVDTVAVEENLRWLPWVGRVAVDRELPDTVRIRVEEREPAALLVEDGTFLVDSEGRLIKEMAQSEYDPSLLVIGGVEASALIKLGEERRARELVAEALAIHRDFGNMELGTRYPVTEVHYDELRGYTLLTSKRQRFVLGFGEFPEKLRRLRTVLAHLEENRSPVKTVRLDNERQPGKVAVSGTGLRLKARRGVTALPAMGQEMLP